MQYFETHYVTGIWSQAVPENNRTRFAQDIADSFELIHGQRLLAFYDEPWILDYFRHLAFDHNIALVAVPLREGQLPANRFIDEFLKRFQSYAVTQSGRANENPNEKSWQLYWKHYLAQGEAAFNTWLLAKLSKVDLVAQYAPKLTSMKPGHLTWIDPDFGKYLENKEDFHKNMQSNYAPSLHHFESHYNYLGKRLAVGSYCLGANLRTWKQFSELYAAQIERLGHFPYAYDEEVILSLMRVQYPEKFSLYSDYVEQDNFEQLTRFGA